MLPSYSTMSGNFSDLAGFSVERFLDIAAVTAATIEVRNSGLREEEGEDVEGSVTMVEACRAWASCSNFAIWFCNLSIS